MRGPGKVCVPCGYLSLCVGAGGRRGGQLKLGRGNGSCGESESVAESRIARGARLCEAVRGEGGIARVCGAGDPHGVVHGLRTRPRNPLSATARAALASVRVRETRRAHLSGRSFVARGHRWPRARIARTRRSPARPLSLPPRPGSCGWARVGGRTRRSCAVGGSTRSRRRPRWTGSGTTAATSGASRTPVHPAHARASDRPLRWGGACRPSTRGRGAAGVRRALMRRVRSHSHSRRAPPPAATPGPVDPWPRSCVEVDTSTYAIPSQAHVREWEAVTPPGFVFHVKAFGLLSNRSISPGALPRTCAPPAPFRNPRPARPPLSGGRACARTPARPPGCEAPRAREEAPRTPLHFAARRPPRSRSASRGGLFGE